MLIWTRNKSITVRAAAFAAAALMFASPAGAFLEDLAIQTQAQYQLFEMKQVGRPVNSHGGFTTTYNIGIRRPLTPLAKLISNFTVNSVDNNDSLGRQQNRTLNFNFSTSERTYTLNGGLDNITYTSFVSGQNGQSIQSSGGNRNYYLNFTCNEPAWPTTNIQYRNNRTTAGTGSDYVTSQWLTGAYYEFRPFRITFDQTSHGFDFDSSSLRSHSSTIRRRTGLDFVEQILPGLTCQATVSRESNNSSFGGGRTTGLTGNFGNLRLTAAPTPSLLFSVERALQDTWQSLGVSAQANRSKNTIYSVRSEMLPGLALNLSHQTGEQIGNLIASISKNTSANVSARLTTDATLALGWNKSTYNSKTSPLTGNDQTSRFASLQTPLGINTDISADIGSTRSRTSDIGRLTARYAGFTLRNRSRSDMTFALGYRWNWTNSTGVFLNNQRNGTLDFDMSWFPASNMGINTRLNYSSNNGTNISDYITPTVDLRWDISSDSNLTLRYNFNRARNWDGNRAAILEQRTKGLSGRFSYRLSSDSTLDATYDFISSDGGGLEWQRALRVYFRRNL